MLISRLLTPIALARARDYPVVTITGPRQSGKTTLCRQAFPSLAYVNLEDPTEREFARNDPHGFLGRLRDGAIIDEVQRVPDLLSHIQVRVDEHSRPGQFILTGSYQFELMRTVTQSLAGRTALLRLLPLSINELREAGIDCSVDRLLFCGGYPRIFADQSTLDPSTLLGDYFETYIERDLRQLIDLRNLSEFRRFVQLCAGRSGQLLNLQSLGNDAGITANTCKAWINLLEASFLVKSQKLYFYDVGLAAWLCGIRGQGQVASHPLRGHFFENLVILEFLKHFANQGLNQPMHFYRDSNGVEVDLLIENTNRPGGIGLVEIKSAETYQHHFAKSLYQVGAILGERTARQMVVYGGRDNFFRQNIEVAGVAC
jgi:uncharacterized protein